MGNVALPHCTDIWDEYQSKKALCVPCGIVPLIPDDYRVLNQFLQKEHWLEHVKGLDASVAAKLCSCSVKHVVFGSLPRCMHAFLAKYQGKMNSYFLQWLIRTTPSSEHAKNFPHHHRAVHFDAHQKYSNCIAGALALLLRNVNSPREHYRFHVPPKIAKVSHKLYAILETNPDGSGDVDEDDRVDVNGEEPDSDDEDHYPDGDCLLNVSPDVGLNHIWPDELAEDVAVDIENPYPYGMSETWEIPRYEDAIQKKVVELLKLLFTQDLNDGMEDSFQSMYIWYTILSSL
jgi:hypothetical protein